MDLLEADPVHLAQQLTVYANRLFKDIKPEDLVARFLEPRRPPPIKDSLQPVINCSNATVHWVMVGFATVKDAALKTLALENLIACANECRRLNNYATLMDLVAALNVTRMRTKSMPTPPALQSLLSECRDILPPRIDLASFQAKVGMPCVPPLPLFLMHPVNNKEEAIGCADDLKKFQTSTYYIWLDPMMLSSIEQTLAKAGAMDPEKLTSLDGKSTW